VIFLESSATVLFHLALQKRKQILVLTEVTVDPTDPQIPFEWPTVLQNNLALFWPYKIVNQFELGPTKFGGPNWQAHFGIVSQNFRRNKSMPLVAYFVNQMVSFGKQILPTKILDFGCGRQIFASQKKLVSKICLPKSRILKMGSKFCLPKKVGKQILRTKIQDFADQNPGFCNC
jgi:hypothetical protein